MRLALAALLLLAAPAGARCPERADLEAGVRLTYEGGITADSRRLPDGTLETTHPLDSGEVRRELSLFGVHLTDSVLLDAAGAPVPGTGTRLLYPSGPDRLPKPKPGFAWEGTVTWAHDDGAETPGYRWVAFSEAPPLVLGACRYEAVLAEIRNHPPSGASGERHLVLPELGLAILIRLEGRDMALNMTPLSLEPLAP